MKCKKSTTTWKIRKPDATCFPFEHRLHFGTMRNMIHQRLFYLWEIKYEWELNFTKFVA